MRYLILFFAFSLSSCNEKPELYQPCSSSKDCDHKTTDACLTVAGEGRCTKICKTDDDCGTGVCRGDLAKAPVCWPE